MRLAIARLLSAAVVVLGVSAAVFLLVHLVPGDPIDALLGEAAANADRGALRQALGLDAPLAVQWWRFVSAAATGDLGTSLGTGRLVAALLAERLPYTAALALAALAVALAIAFPLGTLAALRAGGVLDALAGTASMLGAALPNFLLGPIFIIVFALWLGWFPIGGAEGPRAIVLPALTLGSGLAALLARMIRAALLEVLAEEHVRAARARGLGPLAILRHHVFPPAALPILTVVGAQLGALLGGAVITETVFGWPGLGQLAVEAIQRRDYPLVQGTVLVISVSYVVLNTLVDLLYARLDPRLENDAG
ncbi:MAG: ABC transporter permease [Gammaproteobacteria bacterium]|nr:ABC transporter permease [Gammaproteobacteria bacterium]